MAAYPEKEFGWIYLGKLRPSRRGQRCRIICKAGIWGPNGICIEFEDGFCILTLMHSIEKIK
ncbi:MAG TPA: hypothetical protein DCS09_12780 [Porphyromonadaceae bacterium]|nr:hypothetical protein [Porphyromonadaceae bacterium]